MSKDSLKPCEHLRRTLEVYRGGYGANEHGDSRYLGSIKGERCLDCNTWLMLDNRNNEEKGK